MGIVPNVTSTLVRIQRQDDSPSVVATFQPVLYTQRREVEKVIPDVRTDENSILRID